MNCAYHIHNAAVVNCNGCGKPLCASCDHRIKGFPFCQDCIVSGIELLRQHNQSSYAPFVKRQTSPLIATVLSFICPGLGAAYNGQTAKALIYFAVFVGLFQMAVMTGMAIFVLGFLGMWVFAAVDAWRTANMIRSGVTPDDAQDILVQRFSGNPKAWGIVLTVLGVSFFLKAVLNLEITKVVLPFLLIGLGVYLLREYIFKKKASAPDWSDYPARTETPNFVSALSETNYKSVNESDYETKTRVRNWKNR
jgi:hypothetical protein